MDKFDISFQLEQKDWYAFQKYFLDNSKRFRKTKLVVSLMMPTLFLVLAVNDILSKGLITPMVWIYGLTALISAIFLPKWLTKRTINKAMAEIKDDPAIFGNQRLKLENKGIDHEIGGNQNSTKWNQVASIEFSKAHFFIMNKNNAAIIIPHSVLEKNEIDELRNFLQTKNLAN